MNLIMANNSNKKIHNKNDVKICRICLKNETLKISLLCKYAQQENIISRLEKYFQIRITLQDKRPKYICCDCYSKLKLTEQWAVSAQENQKVFDDDEEINDMFTDESLRTPTESTEERNNSYSVRNCNNKNNRDASYNFGSTSFSVNDDSQQLFVPKATNNTQILKPRKSFPFKSAVFESQSKKARVPENHLNNNSNMINTFIKQKVEDEGTSSPVQTARSIPHKIGLIKTFEKKMDAIKRRK